MKSVIQESSSLSKAIEQGWIKAGKPREFTIKIFQEAKKNFFGFTTIPAKIGIFFRETFDNKESQQKPQQRHSQSQSYRQPQHQQTQNQPKRRDSRPNNPQHPQKEFVRDNRPKPKHSERPINPQFKNSPKKED